jgi:hypothetical protein
MFKRFIGKRLDLKIVNSAPFGLHDRFVPSFGIVTTTVIYAITGGSGTGLGPIEQLLQEQQRGPSLELSSPPPTSSSASSESGSISRLSIALFLLSMIPLPFFKFATTTWTGFC